MLRTNSRYQTAAGTIPPATLADSPTTIRLRGDKVRATAAGGIVCWLLAVAAAWRSDLKRALFEDCSDHPVGCRCNACTERPFWSQNIRQ